VAKKASAKKPAAKKTAAKKPAAKKTAAKKPAAKRVASAGAGGFGPVFSGLRDIMARHGSALVVKADTPENYLVNSPKPYNKKELFFGAVQAKTSYVSFHLFPVYMFPELLKSISPELKKRMQGKSCFNFSSVDEGLFQQLDALTRKGFEEFQRRELV
jgi:hypothetical protein